MNQPTVPQLDLPPVSIGRYFDLLRRRKWQVVPISLLGLLVGALVAFLVPRYYVARTVVQYENKVLDDLDWRLEDPMARIVANAEIAIPECVPEAIDRLGWEEAAALDDEAKRAFISEVVDRLEVIQLQKRDTQASAFLGIVYRDLDDQRAADMANTVREIWIEKESRRIVQKGEAELVRKGKDVDRLRERLVRARENLADFERSADIDAIQVRSREGVRSVLGDQKTRLLAEERALDREIEGLEEELEEKTDRLSTIRPEVSASQLRVEDKAFQALVASKLKLYMAAKQRLENLTEANPRYASTKKLMEKFEEEYQQLLADHTTPGGETKKVPNPDYTELANEIAGTQERLDNLRRQRQRLDDQISELERQLEEVPALVRTWEQLRDRRDDAGEELDAAMKARQQALDKQAKLYDVPITTVSEARRPPRPTEPNITLVALTGSLLGLGLAIALILLIDFLQQTFKTVADVEQGLSVPVLGAFAHVEPEEHRAETGRSRRRMVLASAVVFLLLIGVVATYYVDPTRLPGPVRDVLSLVLDQPGATDG